jgi:hypothetical protein
MQDWTKVVTEPLGLGGFALFLVFGVLARVKRDGERRWLAPMAMGMAVLALAGGLMLAYMKTVREAVPQTRSAPVAPAAQPAAQPAQVNQVDQKTSGAGSPAVQGVQGDVTITVDQSAGTYKKKPVPRKTAEKTAP